MPPDPFQPIYPNPYIAGNPIRHKEMFFGRVDEFRFIERLLEGGRKTALIVLYGERRSGKSSILYQILNGELGEAFLPIFIDMQIMAGIASDAEFFGRLITDTCKALAKNGLFAEPYTAMLPGANATEVFRKFLEDLRGHYPHRAVLMLVDEYEILEAKIAEESLSSYVLIFFAGLLESEQVSFVFTGSKRLEMHDQMLWQGELLRKATSRKISFLTEEDAGRLVTQPLQGQVAFTREAVAEIYALTAGQPFYTQLICQNLVYHLNEIKKREVESEDLHAVVDGIIENPPPQLLFNWSEHAHERKLTLSALAEFSERHGVYLPADELCQKIARSKLSLDLDRNFLSTELAGLLQDEYVLQKGRRYSYRLDLYRRWVRHDHSIWQVKKEIGPREIARITKMARQKKAKRKRVVSIVEHALLAVLAVAVAILATQIINGLWRKQVKVTANAGPFAVLIDGEHVGSTKGQEDSTEFSYMKRLSKGPHDFKAILLASGDTLAKTQTVKGGLEATIKGRTTEVEFLFPGIPVTITTDADHFLAELNGKKVVDTKGWLEGWHDTFHVVKGNYQLRVIDAKTREFKDTLMVVDHDSESVHIDFENVVALRLEANAPFQYKYEWRDRNNQRQLTDFRLSPGKSFTLRGLKKELYQFTFINPLTHKAEAENYSLTGDTLISVAFDPPVLVSTQRGHDEKETSTPLPPALYRLTIITQPSGATVFLNGAPGKGLTPFVEDLKAGTYVITLAKEGYDHLQIQRELSKTCVIDTFLAAQYGSLLVVVKDQRGKAMSDTEVYINQEKWGETPLAEKKILAGHYLIEARYPTYPLASDSCEVKKGKLARVELTLKK